MPLKIDKHIRKRFRIKRFSDEWIVIDELNGQSISFGRDKSEAEHTAKGLNATDQTYFESTGKRIYIGKIRE